MKELKLTNRDNLKLAFTLVEVLLTLTVIGIVVVMTIPTLSKNIQDQARATKLKVIYSQVNEAWQSFAGDEGCLGNLGCTGIFEGSGNVPSTNAINGLSKYIESAEVCSYATNLNPDKCSNKKAQLNSTGFLNPYGAKMLTRGGYSLTVYDNLAGNCDADMGKEEMLQTCAEFIIDVNGPNGLPNMHGRDVFWFYITNKGVLYPRGGKKMYKVWDSVQIDYNCKTDAVSYGYGCAGRIMDDGWNIKY